MLTGRPSHRMYAKPLKTNWVTSVAMKASILILLTIQELKIPTAAPAASVMSAAITKGSPMLTSVAHRTPVNAATDPGERSFCPAIIR